MGILAWIIFGLLAGVIAKFLVPGPDPGGLLMSIAIGIVGALVGGFLASLVGFAGITGFDIRSLFIAVLGAILLLWIYRKVSWSHA